MNASDSRPEQEIANLAQLLPVPAARHLLLKEHLMAEIQAAHPGFRAVRWPSAGRGTIALAAGIAVLAIMLTASTLGTLARSGGPAGPGGSGGPPMSPSALLHKVAAAATRISAPNPKRNQFEYVANDIAFDGAKLQRRQVWTPVSNLCKGITIEQGNSTVGIVFPAASCPNRGSLRSYPTYKLMRSLPTRPAKLMAFLLADFRKTGQPKLHVMLVIGNVLINNIVPPKFTGALYGVVARYIPGLSVVSHVTDPLGRPGI